MQTFQIRVHYKIVQHSQASEKGERTVVHLWIKQWTQQSQQLQLSSL